MLGAALGSKRIPPFFISYCKRGSIIILSYIEQRNPELKIVTISKVSTRVFYRWSRR